VDAQVRRQLQERKRQWPMRLTAWFLLFCGWALTLQGLYGLMRQALVRVTVGQVAYLIVAPILLLGLLELLVTINDRPRSQRRRAYVALAAVGTVLAAGLVGWYAMDGGDGLQEPLVAMTPWTSVAAGAFIVLVGYRLFRRHG